MYIQESTPTAVGRPVYHGGNLAAARLLFPGAPEPWLDLSTGINPVPYPLPALDLADWARLPEPGAVRRLEQVAAARYGAPADAQVVAAPGTQALIQLLPRLHGAGTVGILGFTYGEYDRVWRQAGVAPRRVDTVEALQACDIAVLVNPNNPDGRLVPPDRLAALARHQAGKGGLLVVDEAFMDVLPAGGSLVPCLPAKAALVLRSFGKTYGLAGVRLGFAVTNAALAARLRALLGPWALSGPAIRIGSLALADGAWLSRTVEWLAAEATTLDSILQRHGLDLVGGTPLFRLVAHPQAAALFRHLGSQGVLLRQFSAHPEWLRCGLPADIAAEDRLAMALKRAIARL